MTAAPAATIRIGLLGCGAVARSHHLPELRRIDGVKLVAVADPDSRARERAGRIAKVTAYEDAHDVLALPGVDAVVITAPSHLHAELAIAAAAAGKHIYLEKPMATSLDDARQVIDEVARSGVTAAMGFNRRRHPLYEQAYGLLREGRIGPVAFVQTAFCEPSTVGEMPEWKRTRATGGGVLLDLASHHIDLLRWLLRDEIGVTAARIRSELSEQDGAWVTWSLGSDGTAQSVFSFRAGHADFLELIGEQGTLRIDRHRAALMLRVPRGSRYGVRRVRPRPGRDVLVWHASRLTGRGAEPSYGRTLRAFVERLRGEDVELPSLDDGIRSLEAVVEAEQIAVSGGS